MDTEWIRFEEGTGYREEELKRAARILQRGGLVAFPTETVYGLGGDGLRPEAAKKIYSAKGRPGDNPLILHISDREELPAITAEIPPKAERLMDAFWPGPMTLVFRKSEKVPYETTGGLDTVAVRMPQHKAARRLIALAGVPVAAPSANTSGRPSPTTAEHVKEDLWGRIDMIIDGGTVGIGVESTIVDVTEEIPVILRPGHITKQMLEEVVGEVQTDPALYDMDSTVKPKAPGMKYRHYAPKAKMMIVDGPLRAMTEKIRELAAVYPSDKVGILAADETLSSYPHGQVLSVGSRNRHTIEQGLYKVLREFDHRGVEMIFSEGFSGEAEGEAIMNRLLKAAGQRIEYLPKGEREERDMEKYTRIIFVSKENVILSPMAEWIMKSILMDKSKEIISRGLVVLFPEPRDRKVTELLLNHAVPCDEQVAQEFREEEVNDETLILTMNFTEKVKLVEDYGLMEHVYTLREFVAEGEGEELEPDVTDPYGSGDEAYEESYVELKDLLYRVKKKLQWN